MRRSMASSLRFSSVSLKKSPPPPFPPPQASCAIAIAAAAAAPPSLLQILPKAARSTASLLSQEEKDVLSYLLHLHHLFFIGNHPPPPSPPSKPHWTKKPWRNGVSSSSSQKVPPSPSFSFRVSEETPGSKKSSTSSKSVSCTERMGCCKKASSSFNADDVSNFNCDCFCCYSIFWRRWNDSPNRDIISQILEMVEMQDYKISGIAQTNDQERKQSINVEEVAGKKQRKKKNEKKKGADVALELQSKEQDMARKVGLNCVHTQTIADISVFTESKENFTFAATPQSFQAVTKSTVLKKKDSKGKSMKSVAPLDETQPWVSEVNNDTEETEQASIAASAGSSAFHHSPRHQVSGKRKKKKKNQVTPLDCESHVIDEEKEEKEDDSVTEESAIFTDTSLKETGFIERVVRGTLGGVASRLWNLVSLRFGSQSVDSDFYY